MNETLNLKNYQLETVFKALNYPMPFFKGRIKNRFLAVIAEKSQALEKNRIEMLTAICDKDKDKKPIMKDGNFSLSDKNTIKWRDEYAKMMDEECLIDVTPSMKVDLGPIKEILNASTVELDEREVMILEQVVEALEIVKPKAKKK